MGKTTKQDMIGKKYGLLTVISEITERDKNGFILYNVKCDCGKEKIVLGSSLRRGASRSCNKCYLLLGTHGMWKSKEYSIWGSMKDRCYNKNNTRYKNYGGRGIIVCDRWINSFENFFLDMGNSNGLSIDRIDVNRNYEPKNCKWSNPKQQANNRTNNTKLTYKNQTMNISEWCEFLKMSTSTFHNRISRGWSIEKIIETPINKKHKKK
jgi:hypothetical protein